MFLEEKITVSGCDGERKMLRSAADAFNRVAENGMARGIVLLGVEELQVLTRRLILELHRGRALSARQNFSRRGAGLRRRARGGDGLDTYRED